MAEQPLYQLLPDHDAFDLAMLRESISEHGVREPIVVDEYGQVIDGHARKMIADEGAIHCPERVVSGLTDQEKRDYALTANAARRQLTISQRREVWGQHRVLIAAALTADPRRSDRSVASEIGSTHPTVAAVREQLEQNGSVSILERRGRGAPHEGAVENVADHRNDVWFELTYGYACERDEIRRRQDQPYPQASERLIWSSGRSYLTSPAPRNDQDAAGMIGETARRVQRQIAERPLKTMLGVS